MIIWTYHDDLQKWIEEKNPFATIARIIDDTWNKQILIATTGAHDEYESIISTLKIIRKSKQGLHIIIGIAHPTAESVHDFLEHGASEVWAVNIGGQGVKRKYDLRDTLTIRKNVCPALHIKDGDPIELSVCGKRNNRLILVMHHFKKWCLADYNTCPYWLGKMNDC